MANATSMQTSVKRAVADAREGDFEGLKENATVVARQATKVVEEEFSKVRKAATKAANSVTRTASANPVASAGVCFGLGALFGAAIYAAARPAPTGLEVVLRALRNTAESGRDGLLAGWRSARRAAR